MGKSKKSVGSIKRGFTLLEILIVIGLVGLIVSFGIISSSQINKNSRDSVRKTDLQNISQALELYRSNNNGYPATLGALSPSYLATIPKDPGTKVDYPYTVTPAGCGTAPLCTSYTLTADLEGSATDYSLGPYGETTPPPPTSTPAPTATPTTPPPPTPTPASCAEACQQKGYSRASCRDNCGSQYPVDSGYSCPKNKCCCGN